MEKLTESKTPIFYRGTVIILKDCHTSVTGKKSDIIFAMIGVAGSDHFEMLDLYRAIGGCIVHNLSPNVKDHFGVNKEGIRNWVKEYLKLFHTDNTVEVTDEFLNEIIYVADLDEYFKQVNRDIKVD